MRIYGIQATEGIEEYLVLCSCGQQLFVSTAAYTFSCPVCNLGTSTKFLCGVDTEMWRGIIGRPGQPKRMVWSNPGVGESNIR